MKLFTLSTKIIASLLVVGVGFFFAVLTTLDSMLSDFETDEIEHHSTQTQLFLSTSIAPLLFAEDYATVNKVIEGLAAKDENLLYVKVYNDRNILLTEFQRSDAAARSDKPNAHLQTYEYPIMLAEQPLGKLVFVLDSSIYKQLKSQFKNDIAYLIAFALIISLFVIALITRFQTLGLRKLALASKRIKEGQYDNKIEISSKDEIGVLAQRFNDMSEAIQQRNQSLFLEQNRLKALLETMHIGILFENSAHEVEYSNAHFSKIWGVEPQQIESHDSLASILKKSPFKVHKVLNATEHGPGNFSQEFLLTDERIILQAYMSVNNQHSHGHLWTFEDITHERELQDKLHIQAITDPLTGLYNRHFFKDELTRMAASAKRHGKYLALILFDLDEFKIVNDCHGHETGDQVLVNIANKIKPLIRQEESLCRLGGDEFALISIAEHQKQTEVLVDRLLTTIQGIYHQVGDSTVQITTSVGISFYPHPTEHIEQLVSHADIAMYQAKARGKNTYAIYDPDLNDLGKDFDRLSWQQKIHHALKNDGFVIHYQGIYDAHTGKIKHYESLIRLKDFDHPETLIYPDHFIGIAERNGQILEIDRYVIRNAIKTLSEHTQDLSIAVNLSGKSFTDSALPNFIQQLLSKFAVDPNKLLIEITETETIADIQDAINFIQTLRDIGCHVCLDDFGTGFASFSHLKHLNVDVLKIDGTFIQDLDQSFENRLFVQNMVNVAKGLGKITVAEFVENQQVLEACQQLGVDLVQGYHLGRPSAHFVEG